MQKMYSFSKFIPLQNYVSSGRLKWDHLLCTLVVFVHWLWFGNCQSRAAMVCYQILSIQIFECVQLWYLLLLNTISVPCHCHRFFFILWQHRPRLLNAFICKFSQARWRQGKRHQPQFFSHVPPIDFFIDEVEVAILTSGGAGLYIGWWCAPNFR